MLIDAHGRQIDYLRVSLTDRCNFRCTYCMPEDMSFAPRQDNLAMPELMLICQAFIELGIKKIRLTGGEPMIHPEFAAMLGELSQFQQLETIAITTNGALLEKHIDSIAGSKVKQLNISLDSVDNDTFSRITRTGELEPVLRGIDAAIRAGIPRLRLNAVVSKAYNHDQLIDLLRFAVDKGVHIAFIEEMPLGKITEHSRRENYLSNDQVRQKLAKAFQLIPQTQKLLQAGPARYYLVAGTSTEVGFISPHSQNFCDSCNRVRLTRKGELVLCLGNDKAVDLRQIIRHSDNPVEQVKAAIIEALTVKPQSHQFDVESDDWQVVRFMNVTGG